MFKAWSQNLPHSVCARRTIARKLVDAFERPSEDAVSGRRWTRPRNSKKQTEGKAVVFQISFLIKTVHGIADQHVGMVDWEHIEIHQNPPRRVILRTRGADGFCGCTHGPRRPNGTSNRWNLK